ENNEDRINEVINVTKGLLEAWREVHNNETVAQ
ncbi:flagella export chaperone FliS, partial [Campylobacter coli]|nr:flagella export chaperone FliS [Campylobacter coli]